MPVMRDKSNPVKNVRRILLLGTMLFGGCQAAHDVAVTSFRVIDAPANFVRRKIDAPSTTTATTTTTTVASDTVTPGRTVNAPPTNRQQVTAPPKPGPSASPRAPRTAAVVENPKPSPSAAPRTATNPPDKFPTAKIVPGKPGYVFSPYDPNGGYVDVNGFTSGSKVKDPYSGKIFLVP